jgi:DNA-binding XRE family transcriptional regulator
VTTAGYGQVRFLGKQLRAHRIAWTLTRGPIPPGLFVCHACDTPRCCNPIHLFLGTPADNMADGVPKGRWLARSRAARQPAAPTSMPRLLQIWRLQRGLSARVLAERAGVSYVTIVRIENEHMTPPGAMLDKLARALVMSEKALSISAGPRASTN